MAVLYQLKKILKKKEKVQWPSFFMKDQNLLFVHGMITIGCLQSRFALEKTQSMMLTTLTDHRDKKLL